MKKLVIHQPNFLPYLGFFEQIKSADVYIAYDNVQFTENEFQNRNFIKTPNGRSSLTLPVKKKGRLGQLIKDVELVDDQWSNVIHNKLRACYIKTPFWDEVMAAFSLTLSRPASRMVDINIPLIQIILERMNIDVEFHRASDFNIEYSDRVDRLFKLMALVQADTLVIGSGASTYLNAEDFTRRGLKLVSHNFSPRPYPQQFGEFIPYLSIVDYLMNVGWDYR